MNQYMKIVNELAQEAALNGEVPIACVIVYNGEIVGKAYNLREQEQKIIAHAEILAILEASKNIGSWKLNDCEMYISTEPCLMCYGAIIQSRIKKIYVGSCQDNRKKMAYTNYVDLDEIIDYSYVNEESSKIIKSFFQKKRK